MPSKASEERRFLGSMIGGRHALAAAVRRSHRQLPASMVADLPASRIRKEELPEVVSSRHELPHFCTCPPRRRRHSHMKPPFVLQVGCRLRVLFLACMNGGHAQKYPQQSWTSRRVSWDQRRCMRAKPLPVIGPMGPRCSCSRDVDGRRQLRAGRPLEGKPETPDASRRAVYTVSHRHSRAL